MPPKINQILSPISELRRNFGGQELDQFWGQELGLIFGPNLCTRKCIKKCPPKYVRASGKIVFAFTDFVKLLNRNLERTAVTKLLPLAIGFSALRAWPPTLAATGDISSGVH